MFKFLESEERRVLTGQNIGARRERYNRSIIPLKNANSIRNFRP